MPPGWPLDTQSWRQVSFGIRRLPQHWLVLVCAVVLEIRKINLHGLVWALTTFISCILWGKIGLANAPCGLSSGKRWLQSTASAEVVWCGLERFFSEATLGNRLRCSSAFRVARLVVVIWITYCKIMGAIGFEWCLVVDLPKNIISNFEGRNFDVI